MVAKTSVAVATTNNAAKDDVFTGLGWLVEDGGLRGALNVLANDPGSAKIVGWSDSLPTTQAQLTGHGALLGGKVQVAVNAQGQLDIDASGLNADLQSLGAGESREYSFYYTAQMANGAYSSAKVTFVVQGTNDAPVISGASVLSGQATDTAADDSFATLTGAVVATDADSNDAGKLAYALAPGEDGLSAYGVFKLNADGSWSFVPNDSAVEALKTSVVETFDILVKDAHGGSTATKVTVTLAGANDIAAIGGTGTGAASEDGGQSTGGTLTVSDRDSGDTGFRTPAAAALQGSYGAFNFDPATGAWTYTLDNAAAQLLGASSVVHETLTVTSADGSASTTIDVTVTGANDAPTVLATSTLTGALSDTAADDSFAVVTGKVVASDIDLDDPTLTYAAAPGQSSAYGTFAVDSAGNWSFTPADAAVEALKTSVTETFAVIVSDGHGGSANATVSVTLDGVNDVAELSGIVAGSVAEDGAASAGGTVTVADRDLGDTGFQAVAPAALQGSYGAFAFDPATGAWTYALDNAAAQALGASSVVHETLTVASADGSASTTIDVTVTGANDAPTVSATSTLTAAVADTAGDDSFAAVGGQVIGGDIDVDDAVLSYAAAPGQSSAYGLFAVDSAGHWTFTPDDSAVEGLKTKVTETFTIVVSDGHGGSANAVVGVDLAGVNDVAAISGSKAGSVAEDGIASASGSLTASDRDLGDGGFQAAAPAQLQGTYGTFSFNPATGAWSYALANSSAAVQNLQIGQVVSDSLTVLSADGSASETIVVKVTGAYDSPAPFTGNGDSNDFDGQAVGATIVVSGNGNNPSIRGTVGNDTIGNAGTPGNNVIWAGAGHDTVNSGIGSDTVYGGSGNDTISGGAQNDTLFGGSGADSITGNDGNDTIVGGYGADLLQGGLGNDTFVYSAKQDGGDTIADFASVGGPNGEHDRIDLSALGVSGFAGLLADAGAVGAHQVGYTSSAGMTTLYVDTDGVFGADMEINLVGFVPHAGDFILAPIVP